MSERPRSRRPRLGDIAPQIPYAVVLAIATIARNISVLRRSGLSGLRRAAPELSQGALPEPLRQAVVDAGGYEAIESYARWSRTKAVPMATAVISRSLTDLASYLEVIDDGLLDDDADRLILLQPHIGLPRLVPAYLLRRQRRIASFEIDGSGEGADTARLMSAFFPTRPPLPADCVRSLLLPNAGAAIFMERALREGYTILWQPDISPWAAMPATTRRSSVVDGSFMGTPMRLSPLISHLHTRYRPKIGFGYALPILTRGRPAARLVFERFHPTTDDPAEFTRDLYRQTEAIVLRHIAQWTLWRFYPETLQDPYAEQASLTG